MKLNTDSRSHAQEYIHGHRGPVCPLARDVIRNLLDDLSAAYGEIRTLNREKSSAQNRINELYGMLIELKEQEHGTEPSERSGASAAVPERRRPVGNSG